MLAVPAQKLSFVDHFNLSPSNFQRFAFHQRFGNLPVCRLDHPAEGGPRNAHPLCGLLLVEALEVGQPDGFEFIHRQNDGFQSGQGDSLRFEKGAGRLALHPSAAKWSGHSKISVLIMSICS